ncbi:MAG: type II toxin-antitoxin system VapC family toxin [Thermomicrobiales bacterium]
MYLLDTDWVVQALARRGSAMGVLGALAGATIYVSYVSLGELYEGAYQSSNPGAHLATFRRFLIAYPPLNLNDSVMERFAETRAYLRRRGQIIADMDLLIAATALHYDLTLLTFNLSHFSRIPDLRLYQLQ